MQKILLKPAISEFGSYASIRNIAVVIPGLKGVQNNKEKREYHEGRHKKK